LITLHWPYIVYSASTVPLSVFPMKQ